MKKSVWMFMLLVSPQSFSSTFHVLLSTEQGAPSPQLVVEQSLLEPPPPAYALNAFNDHAPQKVEYYIKNRATGHLRTIMDMSPNWAATELQQYVIVEYDESVQVSDIMTSFNNDQYVLHAYEFVDSDFPSLHVPTPENMVSSMTKSAPKALNESQNINGVNLNDIWDLSEGMGYVGIVDVGLQMDHPDLRAFDENGNYEGGNLLDFLYQIDTAESVPGATDINVDTLEPIPDTGFENCDFIDGDPNDNMTINSWAGHGTHAAGLIAAKGNTAPGVCKNCGLASAKFLSAKLGSCIFRGGQWYQTAWQTSSSWVEGWYHMAFVGSGVINLSGGAVTPIDFCQNSSSSARCKAVQFIDEHQILFAASAGNNRERQNFPASDLRVNGAAGIDQAGNFWNESPNGGDYTDPSVNINCPQYDPSSGFSLALGDECGSNFSNSSENGKVDSSTLSRNVYSIFYQGQEHNAFLPNACTDAFDGVPNDGYGLCTGTSMSAPQVAGYLQLMRSTMPLLPNGTQDPNNLIGIRNVFNATSSRYTSGQGRSDYYGYGEPNPRLALETILGQSNGAQLKTRLTPMFALVSPVENNNAYTPFPQVAMSYLMNNTAEYITDPSASVVNEFTQFWYDETVVNFPTEPVPRANFYVFTTNNNPFTGTKNLVPLRRMEKTVGGSRNDTYAVSDAEIETLHADSYNYAGIEGYIFPTCQLEPGCIPAGAHKLYRVFDNANFNHSLVNLPINQPQPANSTKIGYVYPNIDTDGDGLIDGQERILGTSITQQDTDGDRIDDGVEYPPAGVPFSDPLISDIIFENGFE